MVYMISYDLHAPTNNRDNVEKSIESLGTWCKYLTTTYLVSTNYDVYQVEEKVTKPLDGNDRMIITKVEKPIRGWLSQEQWDWIKTHL